MTALVGAKPDNMLDGLVRAGVGAEAAGEDRLDCVLGVLGTLAVVAGRRTDEAPDDFWTKRWEGWVVGQAALSREPSIARARGAIRE